MGVMMGVMMVMVFLSAVYFKWATLSAVYFCLAVLFAYSNFNFNFLAWNIWANKDDDDDDDDEDELKLASRSDNKTNFALISEVT